MTSFEQATELFVEYPPLVLGEEAAFAAHLTWTGERFSAVNEGTLVVTVDKDQESARAEAAVSSTPGIFRPVLKPIEAGRHRLRLTLTVGERSHVHDLGDVEIYASAAQAAKAHPKEDEEDGSISFTKEQQWKLDFAHAPVIERELRESVAASATLRPIASREALVSSPAAGVLEGGASAFPYLGMAVERGQVLMTLVPRTRERCRSATLEADLQGRARAFRSHHADRLMTACAGRRRGHRAIASGASRT
ncbi:MAG: hypothetical protein IPG43_14365 [Proteobacteria bacterium]|nr:hypothetical protein [Pseudomonadota bacterium]